MSVIDIHPEELIDKRVTGALSASEAALLDAHLARCEACRFELSLRADLEDDVAAHRFTLPPQLLTNMPGGAPQLARPRMRRLPIAWVAAAAVFVLAAGAFGAYAAPRVWPWVQRVEAPAQPSAAHSTTSLRKPRERIATTAAPIAVASACPAPAASACGTPSADAVAQAPSALVDAPPLARAPRVTRAQKIAVSEAPAAAPAALAGNGDATAESLFSAANRARRAGDVTRASELYRSLQRQFPRSAEAALSRVTLATLLLGRDPAAALASFDAYLASGAQPLTAEALVGRARALRALGRGSEARRAWQEVLQRYPTSVYAAEAREAIASANGP